MASTEASGSRTDDATDGAIRAALAGVDDPCSIAAGRPRSVLDMGLVLGWSLSGDGTLRVRFCVTSPSCSLAPLFVEAARARLREIAGVRAVVTEVDADTVWTPERMPATLEHDARPVAPPRPQEWRARAAAAARRSD